MGWQNPPVPWSQLASTLAGEAQPGSWTAAVQRAKPDSKSDPQQPQQGGSSPENVAPTPGASAVDAPHVPYAELHVHSTYSFLDGASEPSMLVAEASRLELDGLALTDHNGMYGAVRFAEAAAMNPTPLMTVFGAELSLGLDAVPVGDPDPDSTHLLLLGQGAAGYQAITSAITEANLDPDAEKGRPVYHLDDLNDLTRGHVAVLTGCRKGSVRRALQQHGRDGARRALRDLCERFGTDAVFVELFDDGSPRALEINTVLAELAAERSLPLVATGLVHHATPDEAPIADVLAAVHARRSLEQVDGWLAATNGRHLRSGAEQLLRFPSWPDAVTRTAEVARALAFPLREASPQLPAIDVPDGHTPMSWLKHLVMERLPTYYPDLPEHVMKRINEELNVIEAKDFPGYFLIVYDMVTFAREHGILCQGRGSAANAAICYVLGITAVDSIRYKLPFARFLSELRDEAPDIDVDFDAARREEVIQYIYAKYGRRNAAQVANVITYRPKSALRDAAKAFGYGTDKQRAWSKHAERGDIPDDSDIPAQVRAMAARLAKFPRHLGIHSGGMVLTREPVGSVVPIEPARMPGRTVLQWDKEDCAWMGLVKFDMLSLGMLHAMQHTFDAIEGLTGEHWDLQSIPKEEPALYDMLCRADTIGVFQVESRAQIGMLPRLQPRAYYDLVIEIALVRPGPIQGNAVHPYIQRREQRRADPSTSIPYLHPSLEPVLERTLGIPIFQEQLMQMAEAVGGCSPADADQLRRAMGSKRGVERIDALKAKLYAGMADNGITGTTADHIYAEIEAFANFGFAESHSLAFAVLVYASAWMKLHYPAAFLVGLLNAQPMGFYRPHTLVADARRHGVTVLAPDIHESNVDATLTTAADCTPPTSHTPPTGMDSCLAANQPPIGPFDPHAPDESAAHRRDGNASVRLGLAAIRGIGHRLAQRIVDARQHGAFRDMDDLARRTGCTEPQLAALSASGALESLGLSRREALWHAPTSAAERPDQLPDTQVAIQLPLLPEPTEIDTLTYDIWALGLSPNDHPIRHVRPHLTEHHAVPIAELNTVEHGTRIIVGGIVTHRQRPRTASGITFINLEDETGMLNVVCSVGFWQHFRTLVRTAPALIIRGILERSPHGVMNLIADYAAPLEINAALASRDFR